MLCKKKKPDKLIAGLLALFTALSPAASVVPAYASELDGNTTSSVTMDPDSVTVNETVSDGIVLDNSTEESGSITVVEGNDDNESGDDITIGDAQDDGIQVDNIDGGQDGIDIQSVQQDDGSIMIDPWDGIDNIDIADDEISEFHALNELDIDIRDIHGVVKLYPSDPGDSDPKNVKYIRVAESEEGYKTVVTDGSGNLIYECLLDANGGIPWAEFLSESPTYTIEAIADDGYAVSSYKVIRNSTEDEILTDFQAGTYTSYHWDVTVSFDQTVIVDFASLDDMASFVPDDQGNTGLAGASDVIESIVFNDDADVQSEEVVESVMLEAETDALGSDTINVLDSMVDDVDVSELDTSMSEMKDFIADPIYEGYIKDHVNPEYVNYDHIGTAASMIVKQTFFDRDAAGDRDTINEIMYSDDKASVMIAQFDTFVPVYDVDASSDYYVAYVNTMQNDSRYYVSDAAFARNNLDGEVLSGCVYDYDTGLAYIPKTYFYDPDGNILLDDVQTQLAQFIDYSQSQYVESVVVAGTAEDVSVNSSDLFVGVTEVQIGQGLDPEHMEVYVNGGPCLVDSKYDPDTGILSLAQSSALVGSVYVKDTRSVFDTVLNAIFPVMTVNAAAKLNEKIDVDDMHTAGTITLKKGGSIDVGDGGKGTADYVHVLQCAFNSYNQIKKNKFELKYSSPYTLSSVVVGDNSFTDYETPTEVDQRKYLTKWAKWIKTGGTIPDSNPVIYKATSAAHYYLDLDSLNVKGLDFKFNDVNAEGSRKTILFPMQCSHIYDKDEIYETGEKVTRVAIYPVDVNGNILGSKPLSKDDPKPPHTFTYAAWEMNGCDLHVRVIKKYDRVKNGKTTHYVIIGVVGLQHKKQTPFALMKFKYEEVDTSLSVQKKVAPEYDEFNYQDLRNYSLKGTWFGIYETREQAENATVLNKVGMTAEQLDTVGTNGLLKILKVKDREGKTNVWKVPLKSDNKTPKYSKVYVVELKAGENFRVPMNGDGDEPKVKEVILHEGANEFPYLDAPLRDPAPFVLVKTINGDQGEMTVEELKKNSSKEMNGAKFKLEYWDVTPLEGEDDYYSFAKAIAEADNSGLSAEAAATIPDGDDGSPKTSITLKTVTATSATPNLTGVHGVISILETGSIVSGEWPYWGSPDSAGGNVRVPLMPVGIYKLTEIEPPKGYELPEQTEFYGVVRQVDTDKTITGRFKWVTPADATLSDVDNVIVKSSIDYRIGTDEKSYAGRIWNMKESPGLVNVGLLKIDADTGKVGKPNDGALSLKDIEFDLYYSTDNDGEIEHPLKPGKHLQPGDLIDGLTMITDENGCMDTVGLNMQNGVDKGVLLPGCIYEIRETKPNDSYPINNRVVKFQLPDEIPGEWRPGDAKKAACVFPTTTANGNSLDGDVDVVADKDIASTKALFKDMTGSNHKMSNEDRNKVLLFENTSPKIGLGVQKFDIMLDSSDLGVNGKANHGNATLEGHTYVVINGTKTEIRLNDRKSADGKGTRIKSIWEHGDHLKNPYNPTYEELYHCAKETNFQVEDGNGYVCAVLTTDQNGFAETPKDLLPLGVYYAIEVKTKVTDEGYIDYLVNDSDVGRIGEYIPGGDGVDENGNPKDKYVLKKDGVEIDASAISAVSDVFKFEFTQELKKTEWNSNTKTHSDAKDAADLVPRGGVEFRKFDFNSDGPHVCGDVDLSGAHFAIINVSDEAVQNKDKQNIPTWKGRGYSGIKDFDTLKWNDVRGAVNGYMVQEVVTTLEDDGTGKMVNIGRTGNQDLPYGDYLLIETQAPEGYYLNKEWIG